MSPYDYKTYILTGQINETAIAMQNASSPGLIPGTSTDPNPHVGQSPGRLDHEGLKSHALLGMCDRIGPGAPTY